VSLMFHCFSHPYSQIQSQIHNISVEHEVILANAEPKLP
jgi:hypothetical protein